MKKIIGIISFSLLFCYFIISSIYVHRDELKNYWNNEEWKLVEILKTIPASNYYAIDGNDRNLIVVGNNYAHGYSEIGKENFDINVSLKNAIISTEGDYCIIGEKDASKIYMINSNAKIWEMDIQGTILYVSVNKNGYSAIVYKQLGYKSLIKVNKPNGEELFTTYLASKYAVDVEISNDNKTLAIAEIDTDGVNVESIIELVSMNDLENQNSQKLELMENLVITDIEYNSKNKLIVQTDKNFLFLEGEVLQKIGDDFNNNVKIASIESADNPIIITKVDNGLFDSNYVLRIYENKNSGIVYEEYQIEEAPSIVSVNNGNIAMLLENELIVVNSNGKLIKKSDIIGIVKSIVMFNNGRAIAVIHREKIEFMKI